MAKGGGKNDFLEVLMLTGFFCAIFFACWGGYLAYSKSKKLNDRNGELNNDRNLHAFFTDREQRDKMIQYERIQESKRDAGTMRSAVLEVLGGLTNSPEVNNVTDKSSSRSTSGKSKIQITEAKVTFKPGSPLRQYLIFLAELNSQKPHLNVQRLRMTRKDVRGSSEASDTWDVDMDMIAYISETDEASGEPSE